MRPRIVLIVLAVVIVLGIGAGGVYLQSQKNAPPTSPSDQTPSAPAAAPSDGAVTTASPSPGVEIKPAEGAAAKPDLTMDAQGLSKTTAVIETSRGKIKFKFYPKDAPNTVNRIIELIGQGFYNGLSFHRVVPGFVIQGGDPRGDGTGGSGKKLAAEFNERQHVEGTVAMARAQDPNSADSQFYISLGQHPHLDRSYTIFGQVTEGMDVVKQIQKDDKMLRVTLE